MTTHRDAVAGDGPGLAAMARACFTQTFGHLYAPTDLADFLHAAFGPGGLPDQIGAPGYRIRLAEDAGGIVGYAKLGPNVLPLPGDPAGVIELHQLYVLAGHHGTGTGPALLAWAIDAARAAGHAVLALSVYVDNHRARAFYARHGFVDAGRYDFAVGRQVDEDRMMTLAL